MKIKATKAGFSLGWKNVMMFFVSIFLLVMALCCSVQGKCSNSISIIREDGLPLKMDDVCIQEYKSADCLDFYETFDQSRLPRDFPKYGYPLNRPSYLDVQVVDFERNNDFYPALSITWKSPWTGVSAWYGHLVVWYFKNSSDTNCQLFKMRTVDVNAILRYNFIATEVRMGMEHVVKVYTLPPYDPQYKNDIRTYVTKTVPVGAGVRGGPPGDWETTVRYRILTKGNIEVNFTLPPAAYGITRMIVDLMDDTGLADPVFEQTYTFPLRTDRIQHGSVIIRTPRSGNFFIGVWPDDDADSSVERCKCWNIQNGQKKCKNACKGVLTEWFDIDVNA